MSFEPSVQQLSVFDAITSSTKSLIVEARAGSGKTTTLVEIAKLLPADRSALFLAFNKNIATELQQRLPATVQAKTFHSHCFQALQGALPRRPRVDADKVYELTKDEFSEKDFRIYGSFVSKLVSAGKNSGVGTDLAPNEPDSWYQIIDHFGMFIGYEDAEEQVAVEAAMRVLNESNKELGIVDFDDMLYLCLFLNVSFSKFNFVMLDEAQDTNGVQRTLLHKMLAPGELGRLIAVGDPAQSIYGFRGADADAMKALEREFDCTVLPLSVSYRCAQEVVVEAQSVVPEIEAHATAPIGTVEHLTEYDLENFSSTDAILCRITAPLVTLAFGFIRRNTGVRILGREIGQGLIALVKKMNTQDIDVLHEKLERWRQREVNKALARHHEAAAAAVEDKVTCLNVLIEQLDEDNRNVSQLIRRIESLFSDNNRGLLTLCTVHKAKGLEWPRVFILDREKYMPSKWAKREWQQIQETNLIYVAITRAKTDLRYISSDGWKQPKPKQEPTSVEDKRKELLEAL